jgi:bifunctional DNA-binding transcriptional regulator/antitoxin component of YhaV-PrlF toxin-antitoxin module
MGSVENMEKATLVRIGENYEVKLPKETLEGIEAKPGDAVELSIETREEEDGNEEYEYITMKKQSLATVEIPTKKYIEIQEMIDRKEIPFQTVEEATEKAIEEMLKESKK